jgi:D-arabinose 1-dehydrogenase
MPRRTGHHAKALDEEKAEYGLLEGDEAKIHGEGDQKVLDAYQELQKLKEEGIVKQVGLTGLYLHLLEWNKTHSFRAGYPLPTLLRIASLILNTPPFKPVDIVQTYSHSSLQNRTLAAFLPHFSARAKVGQVLTASPFSMGLLSSPIPPSWHPSPPPLREAVMKAAEIVRKDGEERLPSIALEYATRLCKELELPQVVGFSKIEEVHKGVDAWRRVVSGVVGDESVKEAEKARRVFEESGYADWSWASP